MVMAPKIGIIPARAGFTRARQWFYPRPPDHPRSRGVYPFISGMLGPGLTDHPRSRGVYYEREGKKPEEPGSSPLARGLQVVFPAGKRWVRIIPARAGFTAFARS